MEDAANVIVFVAGVVVLGMAIHSIWTAWRAMYGRIRRDKD